MMAGTCEFRVFIIDDDLHVLASTSTLLQSHGYEVTNFHSAESFLAVVEDDFVGCVVTDLKMSGISGIELQKIINERKWNLDVVIVTGDVDVSSAVEVMSSGAITLLEKPFPASQLLDAVKQSKQSKAGC